VRTAKLSLLAPLRASPQTLSKIVLGGRLYHSHQPRSAATPAQTTCVSWQLVLSLRRSSPTCQEFLSCQWSRTNTLQPSSRPSVAQPFLPHQLRLTSHGFFPPRQCSAISIEIQNKKFSLRACQCRRSTSSPITRRVVLVPPDYSTFNSVIALLLVIVSMSPLPLAALLPLLPLIHSICLRPICWWLRASLVQNQNQIETLLPCRHYHHSYHSGAALTCHTSKHSQPNTHTTLNLNIHQKRPNFNKFEPALALDPVTSGHGDIFPNCQRTTKLWSNNIDSVSDGTNEIENMHPVIIVCAFQ
jgi:hypothetical protein